MSCPVWPFDYLHVARLTNLTKTAPIYSEAITSNYAVTGSAWAAAQAARPRLPLATFKKP